jgi:hypothetical protein
LSEIEKRTAVAKAISVLIKIRSYRSKKFRIFSHESEKLSEGLSGERKYKPLIAHAASGMHNHGFRVHKSPAIYAFLVLKVHSVRPVAQNETLTLLSYCCKLPMTTHCLQYGISMHFNQAEIRTYSGKFPGR